MFCSVCKLCLVPCIIHKWCGDLFFPSWRDYSFSHHSGHFWLWVTSSVICSCLMGLERLPPGHVFLTAAFASLNTRKSITRNTGSVLEKAGASFPQWLQCKHGETASKTRSSYAVTPVSHVTGKEHTYADALGACGLQMLYSLSIFAPWGKLLAGTVLDSTSLACVSNRLFSNDNSLYTAHPTSWEGGESAHHNITFHFLKAHI